ncbi:MAG: hypothetical protein IPL40_08555 [Proteobacteria bacterium]|nr:hypothetical protein [Pseudomonadota bacterium]
MRLASTWFARRFASRLVRRFAGLGLAAGLSLALAAGCSDSGTGTKDAGVDRADGGVATKKITIGMTEQLTSLDPALAYQTGAFELLMNINQTLYVWDAAKLDHVPGLAVGEPEVATQPTPDPEDGDATEQTWTVTLREGLTFADGTPFNADAVKYSIDRVASLNLEDSGASLVTGNVTRVDKVSEYKVRFALASPNAYFKALLATQPFTPVNRSMYPVARALNTPFTVEAQTPDAKPTDGKSWNELYFDQNLFVPANLLGLGPYTLETISFDDTKDPAKGDYGHYTEITLLANPKYDGGPNGVTARTERIVLKYFQNNAALEQALKDGTVQVAWNTLSSAFVESLAADSANYSVFDSDGLITEVLFLNLRVPPFGVAPTATAEEKAKALKIRKAIALSVDRPAIVSSIFGLAGKPLYSMVPQGLWSYSESFKTEFNPAPPNLNETKRLLTEAGYSESNKLSFGISFSSDYPENAPMTDKIKADLESTGIVSVTKHDVGGFDGYATTLLGTGADGKKNHDLEAFWLGWAADFGDPDNFLYSFGHSSQDLVGSSLYSAEPEKAAQMDTLLDEAKTDQSYQVRLEKYKAVQKLWAETISSIPVAQRSKQAVARKGFTLTPAGPTTLMNYATVAAVSAK